MKELSFKCRANSGMINGPDPRYCNLKLMIGVLSRKQRLIKISLWVKALSKNFTVDHTSYQILQLLQAAK